jgi:hypothetical protein
VQPPSNGQVLLGAPGEPLFTDWTNKQVGGHAGHAPIAAVLTGWLRPDVPHPHSPPLPSFAFVLFDKREQFFETLALVHAVKPGSLAPRFR